MINKIQKIMLADYLKDKSDMRLNIFITALNPAAKTKQQKDQIKLLIDDYEKDMSKSRLKIIEEYIIGQSKPNKLTKILSGGKNEQIINKSAVEESELSLLKGICGNFNTPATIAYYMLNGGNNKFSLISHIHPTKLMEWLEKYSGQKCRDFFISSGVGHGIVNKKGGTLYTLVDKASGLSPEPEIKHFNEHGGELANSFNMPNIVN